MQFRLVYPNIQARLMIPHVNHPIHEGAPGICATEYPTGIPKIWPTTNLNSIDLSLLLIRLSPKFITTLIATLVANKLLRSNVLTIGV